MCIGLKNYLVFYRLCNLVGVRVCILFPTPGDPDSTALVLTVDVFSDDELIPGYQSASCQLNNVKDLRETLSPSSSLPDFDLGVQALVGSQLLDSKPILSQPLRELVRMCFY